MSTAGARILIVEDDPATSALVTMALADEGYAVTTAPHGVGALALLEQPERLPPDVILLDLRMPIMDGRSFAHEYRRLPGPHAPIIAFSASHEAGVQVDANDVVTKPFLLSDLLTRVERQVQHPGRVPPGPAREPRATPGPGPLGMLAMEPPQHEADLALEPPQNEADLRHLIGTIRALAAQDVAKVPACTALVRKLEVHLPARMTWAPA